MRTVIAIIGNDTETWTEDFRVSDEQNALSLVQSIIEEFNDTLKPGEKKRFLVCVRTKLPKGYPVPHEWEKTNLVTEEIGGRTCDTYKCKVCGITGKLFGFGSVVKDKRYNKEKFRMCHVK